MRCYDISDIKASVNINIHSTNIKQPRLVLFALALVSIFQHLILFPCKLAASKHHITKISSRSKLKLRHQAHHTDVRVPSAKAHPIFRVPCCPSPVIGFFLCVNSLVLSRSLVALFWCLWCFWCFWCFWCSLSVDEARSHSTTFSDTL